MTAEEKIHEAEYNLQKLKNADPRKLQFRYELSNFLGSSQSALLFLLHDYCIKNSIKLSFSQRKRFRNKSVVSGDKKWISFSKWYDGEYEKIEYNKEFGFLIEKRHLDINKKTTKPNTSLDQEEWCFSENSNQNVIAVCELFLDAIKKMINNSKEKF